MLSQVAETLPWKGSDSAAAGDTPAPRTSSRPRLKRLAGRRIDDLPCETQTLWATAHEANAAGPALTLQVPTRGGVWTCLHPPGTVGAQTGRFFPKRKKMACRDRSQRSTDRGAS